MNRSVVTNNNTLDLILALQFTISWAGEGMSEPKRMDWWKTDLIDEAGGGDLFARLLPKTRLWASLEATRRAAMHVDSAIRKSMAKPDGVRTLFFWGFEIDEALQDRLSFQKQKGQAPIKVLPMPLSVEAPFKREEFEEALRLSGGEVKFKIVPGGRELTGSLPQSEELRAKHLAAAFLPLSSEYPAPFYRLKE